MSSSLHRSLSVSLADAPVHLRVSVRSICFDVIRERCSRAGLGVGDIVQIAEQTTHELVLGVEGKACVTLDRFFACFVEVAVPDEEACTPPLRDWVQAIDPLPR